MKHLIRLLLCLSITMLASVNMSAQESSPTRSAENTDLITKPDFKGTDELEIGIGHPSPVFRWGLEFSNFFTNLGSVLLMMPQYATEISGGNLSSMPTFHLTYGHNINKWLNIGAGVYYSQYEYPFQYSTTGEHAYNITFHYTSALVNFRFYWLDREWIRLYSGIGIGVGLITGIMSETSDEYDGSQESTTAVTFAGEIRLIGLTVGKKLYGKLEIGGTSSGIASIGIGYRF